MGGSVSRASRHSLQEWVWAPAGRGLVNTQGGLPVWTTIREDFLCGQHSGKTSCVDSSDASIPPGKPTHLLHQKTDTQQLHVR